MAHNSKGTTECTQKCPFCLAPGHQVLSLEAASVPSDRVSFRGYSVRNTDRHTALFFYMKVAHYFTVFYNILLSGCTLIYLARGLRMDMLGVLNFASLDNTE